MQARSCARPYFLPGASPSCAMAIYALRMGVKPPSQSAEHRYHPHLVRLPTRRRAQRSVPLRPRSDHRLTLLDTLALDVEIIPLAAERLDELARHVGRHRLDLGQPDGRHREPCDGVDELASVSCREEVWNSCSRAEAGQSEWEHTYGHDTAAVRGLASVVQSSLVDERLTPNEFRLCALIGSLHRTHSGRASRISSCRQPGDQPGCQTSLTPESTTLSWPIRQHQPGQSRGPVHGGPGRLTDAGSLPALSSA